MFEHGFLIHSILPERKRIRSSNYYFKGITSSHKKRQNEKENDKLDLKNNSISLICNKPSSLSLSSCYFLEEWMNMSEKIIPFQTTIMLENILTLENQSYFRINPRYMDQVQKSMEVDFWRKKMIQWFHTRSFHLITKDTAAIATVLLDRCLSVAPIDKWCIMSKVGIGCLFIATKLTSDFIVSRKEFLKACGLRRINQVSKLDKFERNVLIALDFHIFVDSIYVFEINISEVLFSHKAFEKIKENKRRKIRSVAMSYFDDIFISIRFLAYRSSEIVAACLWLAVMEVLSYPISLFAIAGLDRFYAIIKLLRGRSANQEGYNAKVLVE
ncbi:hypothetical protein PCANB_002125 [Pneumocystis canis]|nr:hypothetical protein PCANB_002125 [Pneumocystis canis]